MTAKDIDVVVAGHICLDIIPTFHAPEGTVAFEDLFRPGKLTQMDRLAMSSGGPVSNTGIALGILGMKTELMGKVGDDPLAGSLLGLLATRGLDKAMVQVAGEQTSYTIVLAPPGIDRMFLHCPGANNTYGADDLNPQVLARTRGFHLGYPPLMRRLYANDGEQLAAIYRRVKTEFPGVTTSLDMSLPDPNSESGKVNWRRILEKVVPHADLYLPSAEETFFMLDPEGFQRLRVRSREEGRETLDLITADEVRGMAETLLGMGGKLVNIKCGHRGIYTRTSDRATMEKIPGLTAGMLDSWSNRELWHTAFHVDPIASATGSGDSSIAGFLAAFYRGCPIEDAIRISNATGGCNVTAMDALSGIKTWEETDRLSRSDWPPKDPMITGEGWREVVPDRLWAGPADRA